MSSSTPLPFASPFVQLYVSHEHELCWYRIGKKCISQKKRHQEEMKKAGTENIRAERLILYRISSGGVRALFRLSSSASPLWRNKKWKFFIHTSVYRMMYRRRRKSEWKRQQASGRGAEYWRVPYRKIMQRKSRYVVKFILVSISLSLKHFGLKTRFHYSSISESILWSTVKMGLSNETKGWGQFSSICASIFILMSFEIRTFKNQTLGLNLHGNN